MSPVRVRLKELRRERNLTQEALADAAGVTQAAISKLELHKAKRIDFSTLDRLAKALGVEPGELLESEGKRKR